MGKYSKEIVAALIGLSLLGSVFAFTYIAEQDVAEVKEIREPNKRALLVPKVQAIDQEKIIPVISETPKKKEIPDKIVEVVEEKVVKVVEEKAIEVIEKNPGTFSSYLVSVRIELKESTDVKKAIDNVKKACSIISAIPLVLNTEVINIKGYVKSKDGKERLIDLEMEVK